MVISDMLDETKGGAGRLFDWTERAIAINLRYVLSGGFWLSISYVGSSISAFALALVFANFLSPDTYSGYKYVLSVVGVLSVLTLPGLDTSLVRSVARGKEGAVFQVMRVRLLWGVSAAVTAFVIAAYYWMHGNAAFAGAFIVAGCFLPFMDALGTYGDLLAGRKAFNLSSNIDIATRIIGTVLLIAVGIAFPELLPILIAYFAGWSLLRGLGLLYTFKKFPPNSLRDPEVIPYGIHLTTMKGATIIAGSLGSILLFHIGGVALAVFAIAVAPIEQIRGLLGIFETLALPKFSQDEWRVWTFGTFLRKTWLFFVFLATGITIFIFVAPYIYSIFFSKYPTSILYAQIWSVSLILTGALTLMGPMLRAKQEVRKLYVFNIATVGSMFALIPPLTYYYGIGGLLAAQFGVKFVEAGTLAYLLWRTPRNTNAARSNQEENGMSENTKNA